MSPQLAPEGDLGSEPWEARTERVVVRGLTEGDIPELRVATAGSVDRSLQWGPSGLDGLDTLAAEQGDSQLTFLVHVTDDSLGAGEDHRVAARINLYGIVRGRASWATLGYTAFDPYAGRGLLREGLALVLDHVFAQASSGLGLHRLEAGVQPGNERSSLLLRSLGFVSEGFSPRLLTVPAADDAADAWRDHDRFALLAEDWPGAEHLGAVAFRPHPRRRIVCVVTGDDGRARHTLAAALGRELGIPLLRADWLPGERIFTSLGESPCGAVLSGAYTEEGAAALRVGLESAGDDPSVVAHVHCRDAERAAGGERTAYRLELGSSWEVAGEADARQVAALAVRVAARQR